MYQLSLSSISVWKKQSHVPFGLTTRDLSVAEVHCLSLRGRMLRLIVRGGFLIKWGCVHSLICVWVWRKKIWIWTVGGRPDSCSSVLASFSVDENWSSQKEPNYPSNQCIKAELLQLDACSEVARVCVVDFKMRRQSLGLGYINPT